MAKLTDHLQRASTLLLGTPSKLASDRHAKHVFTTFAKKRKLVYFSEVNTKKDDTHIVRGVTLGISGGDLRHLFGSHDGYDVMCVQRQGEAGTSHLWTVMEFDLHTAVSLPHVILGKKSEVEPLFHSLLGIHRDLQEHLFIEPKEHHRKFIKHFVTYAPPAHAPLVEHIISPELTNSLVDHIQRIVIEIEGDSIYLSVDNPVLSVGFLDKMMHYGILFAKHIDKKMGAD
jgi:hypothetical protein